MVVQIDIEDPESILSRTQQKKIRLFLQERPKDDDFLILDKILYPEGIVPYPFLSVERQPKRWIVKFYRNENNDSVETPLFERPISSVVDLNAEILIQDEEEIISKTQRKKIRQWIISHWQGEEPFYDQLDSVLGLVAYPEGKTAYNRLAFDLEENKLLLKFSRVVEDSSKKDHLRKKLRAKLKKADPQDLVWKTYQQLKSRLPHVASKFLPDPDQVAANTEMYRAMMNGMPANHPILNYLKMMIV